MNRLLALFLAASGLLVAGCQGSGGSGNNPTDLRVVNAVVDAEALDVLVDDAVNEAAVAPNAITGYVGFDSGTRGLKVRSSTSQALLLDRSVAFSSGRATLLLYGRRAALAAQVLTEDTATPSSGHSRVRVAALAPDAGPVDLYLTTTDISSGAAVVSSTTYGAITTGTEVTSGSYRVIVASAGTTDILFQSSGTVTFAAGSNYTVAVMPSLGGKLVNAAFLEQGSAGGTFLPNPVARYKAVDAIPDGVVNVKLDGATVLASVPFTGTSSYLSASAAAHAASVELANVPGSAITSATVTMAAARDYTLLAAGTSTTARLVALADDNTLPSSGYAKLRFVNALADGAAVDVLLNFAAQSSGVAAFGASSYAATLAGTGYTIGFTTPGGVTTVATLSSVELASGGVYSAYLFGTSASPQAKLVRDR